MATDFLYAAFKMPLLACIGLLIVVSVAGRNTEGTKGALVGIGLVRMARGYLGALAMTLACSFVSAVSIGLEKVSLEHISQQELYSLLPHYTFHLFVLLSFLVLIALTLVGLPTLMVLNRIGAMRALPIGAVALLTSLCFGAWAFLDPYNNWCQAHLARCVTRSALSAAQFTFPVAVGFVAAARIPFARSSAD